jgi:nickel superoxide dismutase
MTTLISDAESDAHKITRLTKVKEDHAEILKQEITVLWSDYFKSEHKEKYPDLHEQVWNILKLASKTKQEVNLEASKQLLEEVLKFAEIFYQSKGLEPVRVKSPYPTEGEVVIYK